EAHHAVEIADRLGAGQFLELLVGPMVGTQVLGGPHHAQVPALGPEGRHRPVVQGLVLVPDRLSGWEAARPLLTPPAGLRSSGQSVPPVRVSVPAPFHSPSVRGELGHSPRPCAGREGVRYSHCHAAELLALLWLPARTPDGRL